MSLKLTKQECPLCKQRTLQPLMFNHDTPYMAREEGYLTREDITHGTINLARGIPVYIKRCSNCGYIARLDARIVEKRGYL